MSFGMYAIQFYIQSSLPLLRRFLQVSLCYIPIQKRVVLRDGEGKAGGTLFRRGIGFLIAKALQRPIQGGLQQSKIPRPGKAACNVTMISYPAK